MAYLLFLLAAVPPLLLLLAFDGIGRKNRVRPATARRSDHG